MDVNYAPGRNFGYMRGLIKTIFVVRSSSPKIVLIISARPKVFERRDAHIVVVCVRAACVLVVQCGACVHVACMVPRAV